MKELKNLKLKKEFMEFIKSYSVISVAVAIVMGQAVSKLINAIVEGFIMPILEVMLPGEKWQEAIINIGNVHIKIGLIIAAVIDFFVIAMVIFFFVRYILKIKEIRK